jgi:hypothetical protein
MGIESHRDRDALVSDGVSYGGGRRGAVIPGQELRLLWRLQASRGFRLISSLILGCSIEVTRTRVDM